MFTKRNVFLHQLNLMDFCLRYLLRSLFIISRFKGRDYQEYIGQYGINILGYLYLLFVKCKCLMEKNSFSLSLHDTSVLKGIAICAMLCHHLFYQSPESGYVVWHLAMLGKVCVAIFLLLSGYGLTIQMKKLVTNSGGEIRGGKFYASC